MWVPAGALTPTAGKQGQGCQAAPVRYRLKACPTRRHAFQGRRQRLQGEVLVVSDTTFGAEGFSSAASAEASGGVEPRVARQAVQALRGFGQALREPERHRGLRS